MNTEAYKLKAPISSFFIMDKSPNRNPIPAAHTGFTRLATFSGGETHVMLESGLYPQREGSYGLFVYGGERNLMDALQLADILREQRGASIPIDLFLQYLPYSRQDRHTCSASPFSLRIYADLIKLGRFRHVYTHDVHSGIAKALIPNLINFDQRIFVDQIFESTGWKTDEVCFVAPDVGAAKKVEAMARYCDVPFILASKTRDPSTGRLSGTRIYDGNMLNDKHAIILDDICDGGGTFSMFSKELASWGCVPKTLNLAVTHGIFSKGLIALSGHFNHIFTTDSFQQHDDSILTTFPIKYR